MRGGYITHGPRPRTYEQRTPKKMIAAAIRGALSDRARNGRLHVVAELFKDGKPSTKSAASIIASLTKGRHALIVLDRSDDLSYKSLRNLKDVHVLPVDQVNAYDVLLSDDVVFTKAALDVFIASSTKSAATTSKEG
jgi:large subunit ribosomal protein L4